MSDKPTLKLSARDLEIAGLVWRCFKTEPSVDYAKLAELAGFKNPGTASACWGPIKKRLMGTTGSVTPKRSSAAKTATRAKSSPKKRKTAEMDGNESQDDDEDVPAANISTSTPKRKRGPAGTSASTAGGAGDTAGGARATTKKGIFGDIPSKKKDLDEDDDEDIFGQSALKKIKGVKVERVSSDEESAIEDSGFLGAGFGPVF